MKLIKPSFEIWQQPSGLEGIYKQIERVARVCYKSEDKITENSAKEFVDRMIKSGHGAMLEHGTVYLKVPYGKMDDNGEFENEGIMYSYHNNHYSIVKSGNDDNWYITTNYRVLVENDWLNDLMYLCDEPTIFHEKRICVRFICDRGVSHEFVRHRVFSFAQESTRYCNYSKNKFGNELTFIIPCWMDISEGSIELGNYDKTSARYKDGIVRQIDTIPPYIGVDFIRNLCESESDYLLMLKRGWTPQQARAVLPNALKTELVMTGFVSDWKHFFRLRSRIAKTGKPHPQAQELADPLMDEFVKRGIIETLL